MRARATIAILLAAMGAEATAAAQQNAFGHGVDRLYLSAPGAGWFVMDSLAMHGRLSGTFGMTLDYAHDPLRISSAAGARPLPVVANELLTNLGIAATYDRYRVSLDFNAPLLLEGSNGTVGERTYTAPDVNPGSRPDTLGDVRLGFDARLYGAADGAFRAGLGVQLFAPTGDRSNYFTDHTYRAMARMLVAGDRGRLTYAGHLGAHVRPLDEASVPGSPRGSELLFGVAGGATFLPCPSCGMRLVVGPELYGASAFRSFFGRSATALEALFGARLEGTADDRLQLRIKLGVGAGNAMFGAPDARVVVGVELFECFSKPER